MSVRFKWVQMFENSVSSRFATVCQKKSTRRGPPAKRDPKTTSAWPSRMGWSRRGYSAGSYSRSASWTRAISPVTCSTARRTAAPLPWLCSWKRMTRRVSGLPGAAARRGALLGDRGPRQPLPRPPAERLPGHPERHLDAFDAEEREGERDQHDVEEERQVLHAPRDHPAQPRLHHLRRARVDGRDLGERLGELLVWMLEDRLVVVAGDALADLLLPLLVEVAQLDGHVVQLGLRERVEDVRRALRRPDRVHHAERLHHLLRGLARVAVDARDLEADAGVLHELGRAEDELVGHRPLHVVAADVGVARVDAHEDGGAVGGLHRLHQARLDGGRVPEAVPGEVHLLAVHLAELLHPVQVGGEVVVVDGDETDVIARQVLLELRHDVRDRPLAEEVALPFEDLQLVVDVAERTFERAAAAREDLEVVLEAAVLPPELLLREGKA